MSQLVVPAGTVVRVCKLGRNSSGWRNHTTKVEFTLDAQKTLAGCWSGRHEGYAILVQPSVERTRREQLAAELDAAIATADVEETPCWNDEKGCCLDCSLPFDACGCPADDVWVSGHRRR